MIGDAFSKMRSRIAIYGSSLEWTSQYAGTMSGLPILAFAPVAVRAE